MQAPGLEIRVFGKAIIHLRGHENTCRALLFSVRAGGHSRFQRPGFPIRGRLAIMFNKEPNPSDPRDRRNLSPIAPILEAFTQSHDITIAWFGDDNAWVVQGWYNLYWENSRQPCRIVVRLEEKGRPTISISPMVNIYSPSQRCWFCYKEDSPAKMRQILEEAKEYAESQSGKTAQVSDRPIAN